MAAQLFRIGKPNNGQRQMREKLRFDLQLDDALGEEEDDQTAGGQRMRLGGVQERFVGYFELPDRCVPFDFAEETPADGFPAVIDLAMHAKASGPSDPNNGHGTLHFIFSIYLEPKTNEQKSKSLFAQHFVQIAQREQKKGAETTEGTVDRAIKSLELMPTGEWKKNDADWMPSDDPSGRYAIDPVRSDFTVKCLRHVVSRQEQQLIRLFDVLGAMDTAQNEFPPQLPSECVFLLEETKRSIGLIRPIYLEQIQSEESGRVSWRFARHSVDPFSDGAWTLAPIRRVLDAVQQRNSAVATSDDVEIVRLALLWTVSLFLRRPLFFRSSVCVCEFFCRLAEIYLIGPEVFLYDQQIRNCVSLLTNDFLIGTRQKGPMALRLSEPIASLDQFMPFYEDLLQRYENFSDGDDNFALLLLVGTYLNASRLDGLLMAQTLWSPKRDVVRQMVLPEEKAGPFISFVFANDFSIVSKGMDNAAPEKALTNEEIVKLMANYVYALEKGTVVKERNGAMFVIAIAEIKQFVGRNEVDGRKGAYNEFVEGLQKSLSRISHT